MNFKLCKVIVLSFFLVSIASKAHSQLEIKINPLPLFFSSFQVSGEIVMNPRWGMQVDLFRITDYRGGFLLGKYYQNKELNALEWYFGPFITGILDEGIGIGMHAGYKWISKDDIIVEVGAGVGRGTGNLRFIPYANISVGYRFESFF